MMLPANVSSVPALSPLATVRSHSVGPSLMRWVHRHPKLRVRAAKRQGFESPRRLQHCTACRDPTWGPYLDARSHVVAELADQVRLNAEAEASAWAAEPNAHMPAELIADVRVWRAATQIDVSELQPHRATPARSRHPNLPRANGDRPWRQLLATQIPSATADSFLPELAEVERSLLPTPSADRGRLVRGSAWHLSGTGATTLR